MNVIHVPRRFTRNAWGGTEDTLLSAASWQIKSGLGAKIFTTKALDVKEVDCVDGVNINRYNYLYPFSGLSVQQKSCLDQVGGNLVSWQLFSNLLKEKDVDLIHAHTGKRLGGIVRTAAKMKKIPYVVTLHGGVFDVPAEESQRHLTSTKGHFEWGKALGAIVGARRVLDGGDAIICVGQREARMVKKQYPSNRVEYLPNGIDARWFARADSSLFRRQYNIPDCHRLILNVGRIDPQKNQMVLIESLPAILRTIPTAHLVLIGPVTNEEYLAELKLRVQQLGLESHTTIVQGIDSRNPLIKSAYHGAEVFCLASIHEPFGIVILEAWASKLPVLSARVGGVPGFVTHGCDAWLVEKNDVKHWSREITCLMNDTFRAAQLVVNGYQKVFEQYDLSLVNRQLIKIYEEVAK